jgi:hypothetical protein
MTKLIMMILPPAFLEELSYFPIDLKKITQEQLLEYVIKYNGTNTCSK